MGLLDLPPELFKNIVHELVLDDGICRGWKYRAVCKTFDVEIRQNILAIQHLNMFHSYYANSFIDKLSLEDRQYFLLRKVQINNLDSPLVNKVKEMADFLVQQSGEDTDTQRDGYINKLCLAAADVPYLGTRLVYSPIMGSHDSGFPTMATYYNFLSKTDEEKGVGEKIAAAAAANDPDMYQRLLSELTPSSIALTAFGHPLRIAARFGYCSIITKTIEYTRTRPKGSVDGFAVQYVLPFAMKHKHYTALERLLELFFTIRVKTPSKWYSEWLAQAARKRDFKALNTIIDANVPRSYRISQEAFGAVCDIKNPELVNTLLGKNLVRPNDFYPRPRDPEDDSAYPLLVAIQSKDPDVVLAVLDAGADVEGPGHKESHKLCPPLQKAIWCGLDSVVNLLLERGATVRCGTTKAEIASAYRLQWLHDDGIYSNDNVDYLALAVTYKSETIYNLLRKSKMESTKEKLPTFVEVALSFRE